MAKVTEEIKKRMHELEALGMSYYEISAAFGLSPNTALYHLDPIRRKAVLDRCDERYRIDPAYQKKLEMSYRRKNPKRYNDKQAKWATEKRRKAKLV